MAFRYQKVIGAENRVFSEDGVCNLADGTVESDHKLSSPYLTLIEDKAVTPPATTATSPAPAAPASQAAPQASPQSNEQPAGKEAAN